MKSAAGRLDWDSLRFALAIAHAGSLAAAATVLRASPSTVFRRINALERILGTRLFDRAAQPMRPTAAGEQVLRAAERMALDLEAFRESGPSAGRGLRATLRITASETLVQGLLARYLAGFLEKHPAIALDLVIENRHLSLSRREADIAFRPAKPKDAHLVGRRLSSVAWSVYASPAYLRRSATPTSSRELARQRFVGWDDSIGDIAAVRWMRNNGFQDAVVYRSNSLLQQMTAATLGVGLAVLPCFLADPVSGLRRLLPPVVELEREIWVLTRRDLRDAPPVRAFLDFAKAAFAEDRALLEGRRPRL